MNQQFRYGEKDIFFQNAQNAGADCSAGAERASRSLPGSRGLMCTFHFAIKGVNVRGNDCPASFLVQFLLGKD